MTPRYQREPDAEVGPEDRIRLDELLRELEEESGSVEQTHALRPAGGVAVDLDR